MENKNKKKKSCTNWLIINWELRPVACLFPKFEHHRSTSASLFILLRSTMVYLCCTNQEILRYFVRGLPFGRPS